MCGITGFYFFSPTSRKDVKDIKVILEETLKTMTSKINHRGPDGEGYYLNASCGLGSRRLAIIDIDTGQMPIYNEDSTKCIIYNGEIYNYLDLQKELISLGHIFKTNSDTEVVLHAYEEWDISCLNRFNGMFAFAIYDNAKNELFCARDHFGIKPFYYTKNSDYFAFASEIKSILHFSVNHNDASNAPSPAPNDHAIYKYLAFRQHDNTEETFFKDIYRLMPGHYIKCTKNSFEMQKYFEIEISQTSDLPEKELIAEFKNLLVTSVKSRLMSEVPLGTCLSGGLDSSSVVCIMSDLLAAKSISGTDTQTQEGIQKTFSAVFPSYENDETPYIEEVLKNSHAEGNFVYPDSSGLFSDLEKFVYYQEEPTISSGPYAQWCVMQKASKKVKVLLDGQGADELLAGYYPYFLVYFRQLFNEGKWLLLAREFILSYAGLKNFIITQVRKKLSKKKSSLRFISEEFTQAYRAENASAQTVSKKDSQGTHHGLLRKRLLDDLTKESIPALLRYEDKNSMAFSVEGRVPFLDPDLVQFVFKLPENMLIRNGKNKYILREAAKELLPEKILQRTWKVGFTTPEITWLRERKEEVMEILNSESFKSREYFNHAAIYEYAQEYFDKKHNDSMAIWRFINLEIWLRIYFESSSSLNKSAQ